jgi:integration host factor subunit alpha
MPSKNSNSTITKEIIAEQLKDQLGFSSLICEEITATIFSELLDLTRSEGSVALQNFGTWKINHKKSRPGFNIKAGHAVDIKERSVLRFIPSRAFRTKINDK